jgi:hypothetical protein
MMTDSLAEDPQGFMVEQRTYQFSDTAYEDLIIMQYTITNTSDMTMFGVYPGLYFDWDVVNYASNAGGWNETDSIGWIAFSNGGVKTNYRGIKTLDQPTSTSHTASAVATTYYPPNGDGFTEAEKFTTLTSGFSTQGTFVDAAQDLFSVVAVGPWDLGPAESGTVSFAIVSGFTEADMIASAASASQVFDDVINACCVDLRGNVDADLEEKINVSDVVYLIDVLFRGGDVLCEAETNVDGDPGDSINVTDLTYLIDFVFRGGPPPPPCS